MVTIAELFQVSFQNKSQLWLKKQVYGLVAELKLVSILKVMAFAYGVADWKRV